MTTLDEEIKRFTDNAEYERTHGSLQGCLEFKQLAEWLKELKDYREQSWIPVSERLPSENGCYLVSTTGTNNDIIDIAYYTKEIWHKASRIKAWMPLPTPYRMEVIENENT